MDVELLEVEVDSDEVAMEEAGIGPAGARGGERRAGAERCRPEGLGTKAGTRRSRAPRLPERSMVKSSLELHGGRDS